MKIKNRLFALLLAFTMVLTYMPALAFAEEIPDSDVAAGAEEEISGEKGEEPDTETDVAQEKESEEEAIVTDSEKAEEPMAEETKAENGTLSKEGEGEEEDDDTEQVIEGTLKLSDERDGTDEIIWGYVDTVWPQNFPMEGDEISFQGNDGVSYKYTFDNYTFDNEAGAFVWTDEDNEIHKLNEADYEYDLLKKGDNNFCYSVYDDFGNEIEIKFSVKGEKEEINFNYTPANDLVMHEYADGWYEYRDGSADNYFYYDVESLLPAIGDKITVDDESYTYTNIDEGDSAFVSNSDSEKIIYDNEVYFRNDQDINHWGPDSENNKIYITYHGVTTTRNVSVKELTGLSFTNGSGTTSEEIDIDSLKGFDGGYEYTSMYWRGKTESNDREDFFRVGDKVTLEYGEESIIYNYDTWTDEEDGLSYGWFKNNKDLTWLELDITDINDEIPDVRIGENDVYITLCGKKSDEPYKIIVTSDIKSITYNSSKPVVLTAEYIATVEEGEEPYEAYEYGWNDILNLDEDTPDTITVKYKDDGEYTYTATCTVDEDEITEYSFVCEEDTGDHPKKLIIEYMEDDQTAENKWEPGEHVVTLIIEGFEVERKVIVEETPEIKHVDAQEPTCTEPGNSEYWIKGGKYYRDEACETEIEEDSWVIDASGHTMTHHAAEPATCTEDGTVEYWSCSVCEKNFSDEAGETELTTIVDPAGHTMTHHAAEPATCTEAGTVEYWSCSVCEKNFSDEAGETELTTIVDPAKGHTMTHHAAVAASCTEDGNVEYWSCSRCEKNFSDEAGETELTTIVDPASGHTMTHHAAVAATCTEDGTVEYWSCSVCEKNFSDEAGEIELTTIVDPAGHTMTHHAAEPATCTEDGTVEYWSCSVCEKNFSDEAGETELTTIVDPAKGHTMTHHAAVAASCTEDGNVEYWSCSRCEKNFSDEAGETELTDTDIVDPAEGHTMTHHAAVAATCTEDGTVEYWSCSRCEKNFSDEAGETELTTIVDPAKGHTPAEAVIENKVDETKDELGSYDEVVYCSVCKAEISRTPKTISTLHDAKDAAMRELNVAESKLSQYDETDRTEIQQAINNARSKIEEAESVEAVDSAKNSAMSVMGSKKTTAQKQAEADALARNGILDPGMPKVTIRGAKKAKGAFTARWKKLSKKKKKLVQGIEVEYASDPYFTQGVVCRGTKKTKTALKIKKLERKKYYWVHVRTYKWVGNTKYVSGWSKSKKVKTK